MKYGKDNVTGIYTIKDYFVKENGRGAHFKCVENGHISHYTNGLDVNMSTIFTQLIKEAARCNRYSSDLYYDLLEIDRGLKSFSIDNPMDIIAIGFRKDGVDGNSFILSRNEGETHNIYKNYFAIYFIEVVPDHEYNDVSYWKVECYGYHV